jgi:transposase InsO family protein
LWNNKGKLIGKGYKHRKLYLLLARAVLVDQHRAHFATTKKLTWDQWHKRFGHVAISAIQKLERDNSVKGLIVDQSSIPSVSCDACIQAKQDRKSFPKEAENRSERAGERFMSDVWGPAQVESIGKWKYYITFIDDATRYNHVLFLASKSDAVSRIKEHARKLKIKYPGTFQYMRFDNAPDLVNAEVRKFAADEGLTIETTAPYSPSQNGVAERFNRTLLELVRAMLIERNLPSFLWDEAVSHATYIRNRSPTRALDKTTPYEAWTGKKPDVSNFREFGCDVWVLDESVNKSKLAPKSKKMIFVGFAEGSKAIRYWDKTTRRVKVSRNVAFNENEEPRDLEVELPGVQAEGEIERISAEHEERGPNNTKSINEINPGGDRVLRSKTRVDYQKLNNPETIPDPKPTIRILSRPSRPSTPSQNVNRPTESSKAKALSKEKANLALMGGIPGEWAFRACEEELPKNFEDAIEGSEGEEWKKAMDEEIGSLEKMGTWRLEELPADRRPIGCRWVYAKKRDEHGNVVKFKARLVAQGFSQKPGTDYNNDGTFAPVMRFDTLRTLLAFAAVHNLKLRQFDVKSAYLHGKLSETIYM